MTVEHTTRLRIYQWFVAHMGEDLAEALMDAIPPMQWDRVATRDDVEHHGALLRTELGAEMADLRTELKTEMADLRTELGAEMADLRTELKTETADLRGELRHGTGEICGLIGQMRGDLALDIARSTRTTIVAVAGLAVSNGALVLAALALR
jgi:ribosomal protein L29